MNKYNKGFALVGIIAIIVAILAVGGGAYYLEKKENKIVVENQIDNQIVETKNEEIKNNVISDCDTNTPPWIKIISPNGGESYSFSNSINIKWESCNLSAETPITGELVDVINLKEGTSNSRSLFCEGSDNKEYYKSSYCLNDGLRTVSLKTNIIPGTYKVKVASSLHTPFVSDLSDNTFIILSSSEESSITKNDVTNQPAYLKSVYTEDGKNYISVDYIQMFKTSEERIKAMVEDGECSNTKDCYDFPNGYKRNVNPLIRTFEVDQNVKINVYGEYNEYINNGDLNNKNSVITFEQLKTFDNKRGENYEQYVLIDIKDNKVIKIIEPYQE